MAAKKRSSPKVVRLPKGKVRVKNTAKIEFRYIFDDSYNPVYANGAFGGGGPQGDLTINFYHERPPIPYSQTHLLDPQKKILGAEIDRDPKTESPLIVRFITAGIVTDEAFARRLHDWLGDKLEQYDKLKKL